MQATQDTTVERFVYSPHARIQIHDHSKCAVNVQKMPKRTYAWRGVASQETCEAKKARRTATKSIIPPCTRY